MIGDREEDEIPVADDLPYVRTGHVLRQNLDGQSGRSGGQVASATAAARAAQLLGQDVPAGIAPRIVELTNFAPELLRRFGLPVTID